MLLVCLCRLVLGSLFMVIFLMFLIMLEHFRLSLMLKMLSPIFLPKFVSASRMTQPSLCVSFRTKRTLMRVSSLAFSRLPRLSLRKVCQSLSRVARMSHRLRLLLDTILRTDTMNYFRGNTRSRRLRMAKIHVKFGKHQKRWLMRKLLRHFGNK